MGKATTTSSGPCSEHLSQTLNEESKEVIRKEKGLQAIREVVSDTEEESHGRMSLDRKVDMLGIHLLNVTS
jgi:hypothetical protein